MIPALEQKLLQGWSKECFKMDCATYNLCTLYEVATILASIPATSCSAESSFSGLRRIKSYLPSTMGQKRLNSVALINIEHAYANLTINSDTARIIDTFGKRHGRDSYFFTQLF